jgi:putative MFS transporter
MLFSKILLHYQKRSIMAKLKIWIPVTAVALGYLVDLYDLLLFSSIRVSSLKELNVPPADSTFYATLLLNVTVIGMLIGGVLWGVIGDKRGRLAVLFMSISTYTAANFMNAAVHDINWYIFCRVLSGIGIAGELGVGLTLISESLPSNKRSIASAIITAAGMLGAVTAGFLAYTLKGQTILGMSSWRFLFMLGGIFGLLLLLFRFNIQESAIFKRSKEQLTHTRGDVKLLLTNRKPLLKFLQCIAAGLPVFIIVGLFISLAPEFGKLTGIEVQPSLAVMWCYLSISVFDFLATLLARVFKSRKKVLLLFLSIQVISVLVFLYLPVYSASAFYLKCAFLGVGIGYWGTFAINSSEQFGSNLRATVSTSVPNIVRFALVPFTYWIFNPLKPVLGLQHAAALVVFLAIGLAFAGVLALTDRFENNIDFQEAP